MWNDNWVSYLDYCHSQEDSSPHSSPPALWGEYKGGASLSGSAPLTPTVLVSLNQLLISHEIFHFVILNAVKNLQQQGNKDEILPFGQNDNKGKSIFR